MATLHRDFTTFAKEVFAAPVSRGEVDYLRNDEFGREVIAWINAKFGDNPLTSYELPDKADYTQIPKGSIFLEFAVADALRALGITDIQTADPEQIMGFFRSANYGKGTKSFPFGVVIKDRGGFYNHDFIANLLDQAGIKDDQLPVALFGLSVEPDKHYWCTQNNGGGIRMDFTEHSTWMRAPALDGYGKVHSVDGPTLRELLMGKRIEPDYSKSQTVVEIIPIQDGLGALALESWGRFSVRYYLKEDTSDRILLGKK